MVVVDAGYGGRRSPVVVDATIAAAEARHRAVVAGVGHDVWRQDRRRTCPGKKHMKM